jgi:beta-glucosidase
MAGNRPDPPQPSDADRATPDALEARPQLLALTPQEQVLVTSGADNWHTHAIARVGLPALKLTDGPNGARGVATEGGPRSACLPVGTALAATWDVALVEEVGRALGEEAIAKSAHALLAPTVNLHRSPLAGRNFECFSEDPELSARMAVAYIRGVQSCGVACTVKHFVANDSEFERQTMSSDVSERVLREIYLRPFEAAVTEAGVWAVMTAYNRVNGTWCSANQWLLREVLKGEWRFDGLVVSDWGGTYLTVETALAGLDLEMPGPALHWGAALEKAMGDGLVPASLVADKATRLVRLTRRVRAAERPAHDPEREVDRSCQRAQGWRSSGPWRDGRRSWAAVRRRSGPIR